MGFESCPEANCGGGGLLHSGCAVQVVCSASGVQCKWCAVQAWRWTDTVLGYLQAGFIDAFVLRNVMKRQNAALLNGCDALDQGDLVTSSLLGLAPLDPPPYPRGVLFHRMSMQLGTAAAHICTVFLAVAVVIGLLTTATAMMWTQTAQLLCNTPTMIIEGAMLLVLMMAHMSTHEYMRARLQTFLQRRFKVQLALDNGGVGSEALPDGNGTDLPVPLPNEV